MIFDASSSSESENWSGFAITLDIQVICCFVCLSFFCLNRLSRFPKLVAKVEVVVTTSDPTGQWVITDRLLNERRNGNTHSNNGPTNFVFHHHHLPPIARERAVCAAHTHSNCAGVRPYVRGALCACVRACTRSLTHLGALYAHAPLLN